MEQMAAFYTMRSFQNKTLKSPGLPFNLCFVAHNLTSCNCRVLRMERLITAIIMTHGVCWAPFTIPSSVLLMPVGCILPFFSYFPGINTRKGSVQMGIKLVYFWRHWWVSYHLLSDQLLVLCLHLVSSCCLIQCCFVFFSALSGGVHWWHADQISRLPWGCE